MLNMFEVSIPIVDANNNYLGCAIKWDENIFITCKHVIEHAGGNISFIKNLESKNQVRLKPKKISTSPDYDFSLVNIDENDLPILNKNSQQIFLSANVRLYGYTKSQQRHMIEPRCIKSYICRAQARPDSSVLEVIEQNELNVLIPKGFSGGPIIIEETNELIGMALGTNVIERNEYKVSEEFTEESIETDKGKIIKQIIVEKKTYEYYGLFHSISNIEAILRTL